MDPEKSQKVPSFTVSGIKRYNFRVKIRFSQHAISDFCLFLKEKDRCFFYATFKNCFTEAPPQFLPETKRFARVKTPQGFPHYATYWRPSKILSKKIEKNSIFCFQGFSLRKIVFSCCFQLCKNSFRDLRILSGFFGAVKLMKL